MAAMTKIAAKFTADTENLEKGLKDVMAQLNRMQSASAKAGRSLQRIGNLQAFQVYTKVAGWVGTATKSIIRFGSATAAAIDKTAKSAGDLGVTFAQFEGLTRAASEAGIGQDQLFAAMARSTRALYDAGEGSKASADAFKALNLSVDELQQMDSATRFTTIMTALQGVENEAQRTALSMVIFGRAGAQLGNMIAEGNGTIQETISLYQRLGLLLTDQQANNVEGMNDSLSRVSASFTGIINQITANLAPAVKGISDAWVAFAANLDGAKIGEYISEALFDALEYAASWVDTIGGFFEGLFALGGDGATAWENAAIAWEVVWDMAGRIYDAFDSLWSAMMSGLNYILAKITESLANWAELINSIPGVNIDGIEESLRRGQQYFEDGSASWGERAAEKWNQVTSTTRDIDRQDTAGSAQRTVRSWRDAARAARNAADANNAAANSMTDAAASAAKGLAGGLDSRSTAGVNYMLAQMRGGSTVEKQQLSTQKQIAQNTARRPFTLVTASI